jgi:hypothetical protein
LLLALGGFRLAMLRRIVGQMRQAHHRHGDLELSDWVSGAILPVLSHLMLVGSGGAFMVGASIGFAGLAIVTTAALLNGVFGAWELLVWMATVAGRRSSA